MALRMLFNGPRDLAGYSVSMDTRDLATYSVSMNAHQL